MNLSKKTFKSQEGRWYIIDTERARNLKARFGLSDKIIAERSGAVSASVVQRFFCLCNGGGADGTDIRVDMYKAAKAVGEVFTGNKDGLFIDVTDVIESTLGINRDLPGIRHAYSDLLHILFDMIDTKFYNLSPDGEQNGFEWYEHQVHEVKMKIKTNFLGNQATKIKLCDIADEVNEFIQSCSLSNGVAKRWIEINPRITFYDPAHEFYESNRELYEEIVKGKYKYGDMPISFSALVTEANFEERRDYFEKIQKIYSRRNEEYAEDKAFRDEMTTTLELIFQKEFTELLVLHKYTS